MNRLMVIALALAGCEKSETKPEKPADCAATITRMAQTQAAEQQAMFAKLSAGEKAMVGAQIEKAIADQDKRTALTITACRDDKWAPELLACIDGAKDGPTRGACMQKLQPAQLANLKKALATL